MQFFVDLWRIMSQLKVLSILLPYRKISAKLRQDPIKGGAQMARVLTNVYAEAAQSCMGAPVYPAWYIPLGQSNLAGHGRSKPWSFCFPRRNLSRDHGCRHGAQGPRVIARL